MNATPDYQKLIRHHLATLAYRLHYTLDGAPDGFGEFEAGSGVRTPCAILNHVVAMLERTRDIYLGRPIDWSGREYGWPEVVAAFDKAIAELDGTVRDSPPPLESFLLRLYQGPWSDAMTHVGQIAMLRRLAGSPLAERDYSQAEIGEG